jgi:UDP-N-acetylmuramoyl-tripeptide--D-alanyl-D-alanine ligase
MIALDLAEVARLTGGALAGGADPAAVVAGPVVIDSRRALPGALFVCLRGEHADGHDFAAAAADAGAVAALAEHDVGVPAVVVPDPTRALGVLAGGVLERADGCTVVGVTGSSGKTSTKDLLAHVLNRRGPVVAPQNSFNNEIGLPLTVLEVTAQTRTLVCEYSARGRGHIAYLTTIAQPRVAVVLNVGAAHLGEFGSRDAVAEAKGELVAALPEDGTAVLNADDPRVVSMKARTKAPVVWFGTGPDVDVRIVDLRLDDLARPRFRLVTRAGEAHITLPLSGAHHAQNAAAATGAALACGINLADIAVALSTATARSAHRMGVFRRSDDVLIVDDAYNANPESMGAALEAFRSMAAARRRWAVLGEMRELGADSDELHRAVGRLAARAGVDELLLVSAAADSIAAGAAEKSTWSGRARVVSDADAAVSVLRAELRPGDAVLVKASNSMRLWRIAEMLVSDVPAGAAS